MQLHKILAQPTSCFTSLSENTALDQALTALARFGKTAVVILESGKITGILTRTDVLGLLERGGWASSEKMTISQLMTRNLILSDPRTPFDQALESMAKFNIEHLPVIEEGRLLTVVHERDLLRLQLKTLRADIDHMQGYIENLHNATQD
jgi:signal-transduction protein with cAMP-binding, CBS, and nucleotidyltransferase domain